MPVKYPSLITTVYLSVVLSSENGVCENTASSVHHSNNGTSDFPGENHHPPVCKRGTLHVLPTLSHKILQRHACKDQDLLKLINFTVPSRILTKTTSG